MRPAVKNLSPEAARATPRCDVAKGLPLLLSALHTILIGLATWVLAAQAGALSRTHVVIWLLALGAAALTVLSARRGRIAHWELCMLEAGVMATASGATGALALHLVFKPAAMTFALLFIASSAYSASVRGHFDFKPWWLLGVGVLASLAGDVFLMLSDLFIPGLLSFLLAHLAYIALMRRGVRWFAHRGALLATLAIGSAMYAWLWQSALPTALRAPVAVYVVVIALMAAQALGRAKQLQTRDARTVALGACLFMLSDALLAVNRFVQPLPVAALWVLSSYFAAQFCIVHGMVADLQAGRSQRTALGQQF